MFTKDLLNQMRADLQKSVKDFEKKYDVKVDFGNISYDEFSFSIKTKVTQNAINSEENQKLLFEQNCHYYGLQKTDYLHKFTARSKGKIGTYEIVGFELSRSKFPIRAKSIEDGKVYLFTRDVIKDIAYKGFKVTETDMDGNPIKTTVL